MSRIVITCLALTTACATQGPGPSGPSKLGGQHQSASFTFHHTAIDTATIGNIASRLESDRVRILHDLRIATLPRVSVYLHADHASLREAVRPMVGDIPAFAQGLVTSPTVIHILSPNLASAWAPARGLQALVHELAHAVSWHLNDLIPNNPRWLWEAVALYEAAEFVHPRDVAWIAGGQSPDIGRLNDLGNLDIYSVGYLLGEFIVARWGHDGLVALIRQNGSTDVVTGLAPSVFFDEWMAFVRQRYLSESPGETVSSAFVNIPEGFDHVFPGLRSRRMPRRTS